ncbi:hypothetical protein FBQ96_11245 [Nitrospirales bacterium NOB]|nr:MAG: hypothetical protein UZ03_NOB001000639 [Nitrospira sp. OLB3]MBV6469747.1 hypothetical protein [Nitrospirota bacterium]MCK6494505.1 hypothetical protein [Nitrospira sp.]MDL1890136.1 hypothetical protein [Nitrospirales bacterium NOB]MEB2339789.1 hypothetical protein [Nitrospirales bacterium]
MWLPRLALATLMAGFTFSSVAQANDSPSVEMWECPGPDGTTLYTNKERPGCQPKVLRALSIAPALPDLPNTPTPGHPSFQPSPRGRDFAYDTPIGALRNLTQVPDSGRDWFAGNLIGGSVQAEVCSMYGEWIQLNQKNRGGFFFGTDPSYGGDPTARYRNAPSYSFYDNARYVALSRIFGAGFIPIGCY